MGSSTHMIFKKIGKGLDKKNMKIAEYEHCMYSLEQQVATLRPEK